MRARLSRHRRFAGSVVLFGAVALAHAVLTWPLSATLALFGGGALVAFVAEAIVVALGWLDHHVGPAVLGVPLYVLFGWTGTIYVAFRIALLVTDGWTAVLVAGALATAYDAATDHRGVAEGYWTYTDDLPGPRHHDVPWWNYLGWFAVSCLTTAVALPFV